MIRIKNTNINISKLITLLIILFVITGCSSRDNIPVTRSDLTISYPANAIDGISAKITFYRKISKKTGNFIDEGTVFTIKEKRNLRALIDIENRLVHNNDELMFHMDWVGEDGKSFHKKQINLSADDSSKTLKSSISISPNIRQPGKYTLYIYLHRELIAEKKFELLPEVMASPLVGKEITADITLYRKTSKKTGKLIGEGTVFKIKKKRNIRALITIQNRFAYSKQELKFKISWVTEDGNQFYQKRISLSSSDSTSILTSSVSISPGKRLPGNYIIKIFLFGSLVGEKKFKITP